MSQELSLLIQMKGRCIRKAVEIVDRAPDAAVVLLRKALDEVIRDVYRRRMGRESGTEPLENVMGQLKKGGYLPAQICDHARLVKHVGNVGVHSLREKITETEFVSSLQNLLPVLKWYELENHRSTALEPASQGLGTAQGSHGQHVNSAVILAGREPGSDIEEEWQAIRSFLINDGMTIISGNGLPDERPKLGNALFVQLISILDPMDRARWLLENCHLDSASEHILQWRKALPNSRIDSMMLRDLDDQDRQFCEGARTGSFEEFKLAVRGRIQELATPSKPTVQRWRPYLYIAADRSNKRDDDYAGKLQDATSTYADTDVMKEGNPGLQRSDFKEALKSADGIVFLYGDTQPTFIENWLSFYKREKQLLHRRTMKNGQRANQQLGVKLAALYDAPPEETEKKEVRPRTGIPQDELPTYGSRDAFSLSDVPRMCEKLHR